MCRPGRVWFPRSSLHLSISSNLFSYLVHVPCAIPVNKSLRSNCESWWPHGRENGLAGVLVCLAAIKQKTTDWVTCKRQQSLLTALEVEVQDQGASIVKSGESPPPSCRQTAVSFLIHMAEGANGQGKLKNQLLFIQSDFIISPNPLLPMPSLSTTEFVGRAHLVHKVRLWLGRGLRIGSRPSQGNWRPAGGWSECWQVALLRERGEGLGGPALWPKEPILASGTWLGLHVADGNMA